LKTSDFDYPLPLERIAQTPIEPRDASRLLVLDRSSGTREHKHFYEIGNYLRSGDLLVVNRSRVVPARLFAKKVPGGGRVELLLLERLDPKRWKALVGGKGLGVGKHVKLENGLDVEIIEDLGGSQRLLEFERPLGAEIDALGQTPLPPYIHAPLRNPARYQTVYAHDSGSAAAPTAGLHFTEELLAKLQTQGVGVAEVTLHIGLDTFAPVNEDNPSEHIIHSEWCTLSQATADAIARTKAAGGRVVAVGTTSVRTLESAAKETSGHIAPFEGRTQLFILPGYKFQVVDAMITNFHLPRSTLLMLVSAFARRDLILDTYCEAIEKGYRFFSFGDAMLIV
jgi:S-adenosylmethionine:tRNA ribosyltransferase-isomerase